MALDRSALLSLVDALRSFENGEPNQGPGMLRFSMWCRILEVRHSPSRTRSGRWTSPRWAGSLWDTGLRPQQITKSGCRTYRASSSNVVSRAPPGRGGMLRDHQIRRRIRPAPGPPLDRLATPHHPLHTRRSVPRCCPGAPAGKRHRLADGMIPYTCNEIRRLPATAVLLPERGKRHLLRWSRWRRRRRRQASAELSHHKRRNEEGLHPDRTGKTNQSAAVVPVPHACLPGSTIRDRQCTSCHERRVRWCGSNATSSSRNSRRATPPCPPDAPPRPW